MPVPPHRPCAERDSEVLPVRGLSHFRGSHSGGGETPVNIQLGIEVFSRATFSGLFEFFLRSARRISLSQASITLLVIRNVVYVADKDHAQKCHAHARTKAKTNGKTASCSHQIRV